MMARENKSRFKVVLRRWWFRGWWWWL